MKKYFMKNTNEEIQFGDRIDLELTKETDEGIEHKSMSIKFTPLVVDMLKKENVIEEKEVEEKDFCIDFNELCKSNREKSLEGKIEALEDRLTELEGIVAELTNKKSE